jgi:ABC-type nitrate/sulfonate/bicarbonate transport system substrate-binding protein
MRAPQADGWTRRRFLGGLTLAGAAGLLGLHPRPVAAEPPPETTRLRLVKSPVICLSPESLAEELLRLEGFSEIDYVDQDSSTVGVTDLLVPNRADITAEAPPSFIPAVDAGKPVVALAGLHGGCYELFAKEPVRAIRDLKGRRVVARHVHSTEYYYVASMVAYVGMNPRRDITWVVAPTFDDTLRYFVDGKADAFIVFPPAAAASAREEDRPCDSQHVAGPTLEGALLLHNRGPAGVCDPVSRRDQARGARHPQSHRHLRPGAGAGRPLYSHQGLRVELRDCARSAQVPIL